MTDDRPSTRSTGTARTGRRLDEATAAHPNARFTTPADAVPVDRARLGGPGGRADRRVPVRRPARDGGAARDRGVRLGARRVPGLDHGLGEDRGRGGRGRRAALRPDGDAAVLRLPHGRLLRPLAGDRPRARARSCRRSSWSTGSARTTTASSSGPASARTAACSRGCSGAATTQAGRWRRRSAWCRPRTRSTLAASICAGARSRSCSDVDPEEWRAQLPAAARALRAVRRPAARGARAAAECT